MVSVMGISKQLPLFAAVLLVVTTRPSGFSRASQDLVPRAGMESSDGSVHAVYARDGDLYIDYLLNRRSPSVAPVRPKQQKAAARPKQKPVHRPKQQKAAARLKQKPGHHPNQKPAHRPKQKPVHRSKQKPAHRPKQQKAAARHPKQKATGHPNTKAANRPKSAANPILKGAICRRGPGDKDGAKCEPTGGGEFKVLTGEFETYEGTPAPAPKSSSSFKVNTPNADLPVGKPVPPDPQEQVKNKASSDAVIQKYKEYKEKNPVNKGTPAPPLPPPSAPASGSSFKVNTPNADLPVGKPVPHDPKEQAKNKAASDAAIEKLKEYRQEQIQEQILDSYKDKS